MKCQVCGKSEARRKYNALAVCAPCLEKKEIGEKERTLVERNTTPNRNIMNLEEYYDEKVFSYLNVPRTRSYPMINDQITIKEVLPMGKKKKKAAASEKKGNAGKKGKKK